MRKSLRSSRTTSCGISLAPLAERFASAAFLLPVAIPLPVAFPLFGALGSFVVRVPSVLPVLSDTSAAFVPSAQSPRRALVGVGSFVPVACLSRIAIAL